jgi:hypothetical protein
MMKFNQAIQKTNLPQKNNVTSDIANRAIIVQTQRFDDTYLSVFDTFSAAVVRRRFLPIES